MEYYNEKDVYNFFVKGNNSVMEGLIALGLIEEAKILYIERQKKLNSNANQYDLESKWYLEQHEDFYLKIKGTARGYIDDYSKLLFSGMLESVKFDLDKVNGNVSECTKCITDHGESCEKNNKINHKFLSQLGVNILGGVLSAFIIALISVIVYFSLYYYENNRYGFADCLIEIGKIIKDEKLTKELEAK